MKKSIIFNLIPEDEFPAIEMSEKSIRQILQNHGLDDFKLNISEATDDKIYPLAIDFNRITCDWDSIKYRPGKIIHAGAVIHEYGHHIHNMRIWKNIDRYIRGNTPTKFRNFHINAEYFADKFAIQTLYLTDNIDELKTHLMTMLFTGYSRKLHTDEVSPHEIAHKRILRSKWFKPYKKFIDPYHILHRKYYSPEFLV